MSIFVSSALATCACTTTNRPEANRLRRAVRSPWLCHASSEGASERDRANSLLGRPAAVDEEDGAADELACVGGKVNDCPGDVGDVSDLVGWNAREDARPELGAIEALGRSRRVDEGWPDGVDHDPFGRPFE